MVIINTGQSNIVNPKRKTAVRHYHNHITKAQFHNPTITAETAGLKFDSKELIVCQGSTVKTEGSNPNSTSKGKNRGIGARLKFNFKLEVCRNSSIQTRHYCNRSEHCNYVFLTEIEITNYTKSGLEGLLAHPSSSTFYSGKDSSRFTHFT